MATVVITPEMQRANAEALLGKDPGKFRDPGQRWTAKRYAEIQRLLKQAEADKPVTILNLNPFPLKINGGVFFPEEIAPCPPGKPYTIHVIRDTRWGHKDLGCDAQNMMQMEPVPAIPGADRILFARWHGADDRHRYLQRQRSWDRLPIRNHQHPGPDGCIHAGGRQHQCPGRGLDDRIGDGGKNVCRLAAGLAW